MALSTNCIALWLAADRHDLGGLVLRARLQPKNPSILIGAHFTFLMIVRIPFEMGRTGVSPVALGVPPSASFGATLKKVKCALLIEVRRSNLVIPAPPCSAWARCT